MTETPPPAPNDPKPAAETPPSPPAPYNVSVGYLRTFIILLVVAQHSTVAYNSFFLPPSVILNGKNRWWVAVPVVDPERSDAFWLFNHFNDTFFMAIMFFLSGLFVWKSLQQKGTGYFLRDRLLRLGLPFVVMAALAPLAYYPAYLQTGMAFGVHDFWEQWTSLGEWPAGPGWFIWMLLVLDVLALEMYLIMPRWCEFLGRFAGTAGHHPVFFFLLLTGLSAVAYIPMTPDPHEFYWVSYGPFGVQENRLFHYIVYFFMGFCAGAAGLDRGLLAPDGILARNWWFWPMAALVAFSASIVSIAIGYNMNHNPGFGIYPMLLHIREADWPMVENCTFVLSCTTTTFGFLSLFVRFAHRRNRIFDSLTANAYGIYIFHNIFVNWLQYAILSVQISIFVKAALVFTAGGLMSWGLVAALRRIPGVARVI